MWIWEMMIHEWILMDFGVFPLNCQTNAIWNSLFDMGRSSFGGSSSTFVHAAYVHHRITFFGMHISAEGDGNGHGVAHCPFGILGIDGYLGWLGIDAAMEILDLYLEVPLILQACPPVLLVYNPHQVPSTISYIFFNQLFRHSEAWHHQHSGPPGMVRLEFLLRVLKQCSEPATASIRSFVACCSASDDSLCVSWSRKKKNVGPASYKLVCKPI